MRRFSLLILVLFSSSCGKQSKKILADRNYDSGNWLLVNVNYVDATLFMIDDEAILRKYPDNIQVLPQGQCGETTCDGSLMLYKDGQLVEQVAYLDKTGLYESDELASEYVRGKSWTIEPVDKKDFDLKWDSLKVTKELYPVIYHSPSTDKDIILIYERTI